jgi:exodeoxyribonuclease VII small subunit
VVETSPNPFSQDDSTVTNGAGNDVGALSYEQARDELVRVVNELEQGSSTLEQSLALWEREEWLLGAKARLDAARAAASE